MSESLLSALIQLFAIVANVNKEQVSDDSRFSVSDYLKGFLPQNLVDYYLKVFDSFIFEYHGDIKNQSSRQSFHGIRLLKICSKINDQLLQSQKYIVLIELLQFIKRGESVTDKEIDFVKTVAEVFKIEEHEFDICFQFVFHSDFKKSKDVLTLGCNTEEQDTTDKFLLTENLSGNIFCLYLSQPSVFFMKYMGSDIIYLNNHNVLPERVYLFDTGSSIRSPKINTIYYNDISKKFIHSASFLNLTFCAENVSYLYKGNANGIRDFSLTERSGNLIGIMGVSGFGKSTLLNLLSGKLIPAKGLVKINDVNVYRETDKMKGIIGFVAQEDILIEELTVFQNLYYNAKLCFNNLSEDEIIQKAEKTLKAFDLHEIRNLPVGSPLNKFISGGERKRLNLAIELIHEPYVLFADEPTSGLSSMDSVKIMDKLKELAINGRLVFATIHQPSSDIYKMFDKILILDRGGETVFYGNPVEALTFIRQVSQYADTASVQCESCGNLNPESILHVIDAKVVDEYGRSTSYRKISPHEWKEAFKEKIIPEKIESNTGWLPLSNLQVATKWKQAKIFFIRDAKRKITNLQYLLINILEAPLLAFIIAYFARYYIWSEEQGHVYYFASNENIPVYIFVSVIVALFMGMTLSVNEIINEKRILQREEFLKLSWSAYLFSKLFLLLIISAFQTLLYVLIGNSILEIKGMYTDYWLVLFSAAAFSNLLGLLISSLIKNNVVAYILIPIILIPQILFCGVVVDYDKLHKNIGSDEYVPLLGDMMISRWAYEALIVKQFKDNNYEKHFFEIEKNMSRYSYLLNFVIPELTDRLAVFDTTKSALTDSQISKNYHLLFQEVNKLKTKYKIDSPEKERKNYMQISEWQHYLDKLHTYCKNKYSHYRKKKEKIAAKLRSKEDLNLLMLQHHNEKVAQLCINSYNITKMLIKNEETLIQKADPVFKDSDASFIRAHFYASGKPFAGIYMDTFLFNILLIWFLNLLLFVILLLKLNNKFYKLFWKYRRRNSIS